MRDAFMLEQGDTSDKIGYRLYDTDVIKQRARRNKGKAIDLFGDKIQFQFDPFGGSGRLSLLG